MACEMDGIMAMRRAALCILLYIFGAPSRSLPPFSLQCLQPIIQTLSYQASSSHPIQPNAGRSSPPFTKDANMFGFDEAKEHRDAVYGDQAHESKLSHEMIAGGAAFEAMHLWEKKQRESGQPVEHGLAKELLAAAAGFEVDKLAETKGLDFIDRERAKHDARKQAEHMYDQQYGNMDRYDPNECRPHESMQW
ncbi:hypothetical protein RB601_004340 [Gaeumannomyces tritici]